MGGGVNAVAQWLAPIVTTGGRGARNLASRAYVFGISRASKKHKSAEQTPYISQKSTASPGVHLPTGILSLW